MAKITILASSDVHGSIFPYSYADKHQTNSGLASLKTLIDSLRDENTIVIDNGDCIEGSPLMFYHFKNYRDEVTPVTKGMNEINYDFVNVGNHDFNYGSEILFRHLDNLNAPCLTCNILYHGKSLGPRYLIKEVAGKKLAFIVTCTQHIPNWEAPANIEGFEFLDCYETTKEVIAEIKEKEDVDYIIAVYHGGFEIGPESEEVNGVLDGENEGYSLMRDLDIDILIAGHTHQSLHGKKFNTVYTETRPDGEALAKITIDTETNEIKEEIIEVNNEADPSILALAQKEEDECQEWLDTTLGISKVNLKIDDEFDARLHKSQLITFLNKVEFDVTGADLAANALFLRAVGFKESISMRDLISTYVFPNTLVVKEIDGKNLRLYLEKCAEFWGLDANGEIIVAPSHDFPHPQHYNYDMLDGVDYTIKVSQPIGQRIIELKYKGKDVKDDDKFTLAINNYRASGGGNFDMIKECKMVKDIQRSMVDILAEWIMEHQVIDFEPVNNIKVIK